MEQRSDVIVRYVNVHKCFDSPVLAGVNLEVLRGETLAVVGPSGTGKSVLLKSTIGLILPDQGDIYVDGVSVFRDAKALQDARRRIGYVFQNAALFDSLTVYENVLQGLAESEIRGSSTSELLRRVEESLAQVNLEAGLILGKRPSELSGGMRKRVGIARAIVGRPEILLYDEPVTGLDPVNGAVVHNLISGLSERLQVTSVLVTHDIEGALPISHRVALLDRGLIRFFGTPGEFRASSEPLVRAFLDRTPPSESSDF